MGYCTLNVIDTQKRDRVQIERSALQFTKIYMFRTVTPPST